MDLIGQAGDLQEAAVLAGHVARAPLQRVEDLLAGGLDHAQGVAEGMHLEDVAQSDVARGDGDADAAAVDERHIGLALVAVGVGAQVAQVGLGVADDADGLAVFIDRLGIVDGQFHVGLGHNLVQLLIEGFGGLGHGGGDVVLNAQQRGHGHVVGPGVQAGLDGTVGSGDARIADAAHLGAAAGARHVLAVLVLHDHLVGVMAVAVKEGVDAGGVGDHIGVGVGRAGRLVAKVRHGDDVVRALGDGRVHGGLHGGIELFARLILHEAVDEVALVVLEVLGGGGGDGLGSGDAHEGNLHALDLLDHIGVEHQLAVLVEVGADVGEVGHFRQLQETVHAIVEFVVAGDGHVVAHGVHQADDGFACGHGADGLALDGVAVVHQQHMAGFLQRVTHGGQAGIAEALVDAAVHVAGEEHDNVLGQAGFLGEGRASKQHKQGKQ